MKLKGLKWTVIGAALAVIVMYGIEMSSSGIERIYGPMEGGSEYVEYVNPLETMSPAEELMNVQQQKIAQLEKDLAELKRLSKTGGSSYASETAEEQPLTNERLPGIPIEESQPTVNRIADSTSGLLQNMSSNGIRMVVSIFDGLTK